MAKTSREEPAKPGRDSTDVSPEQQLGSRRSALRKLGAAVGLVVGGALVPERWSRPAVDLVIGKATAQTSPPTTTTTTTEQPQ